MDQRVTGLPWREPPRVLVLTPGTDGGGISRMMQYLRTAVETQRSSWRFEFFVTHDRSLLRSMLAFPGRLRRFAGRCASGEVDLCHINVASRGSTLRKVCYAAICRRYGIPYVLHLHGGGYPQFLARGNRLTRAAIGRLFLAAARVLVLGASWRVFVRDRIGVPVERIAVLPNAVPAGPDASGVARADPPLIVFAGLIHRNKGVDTLLEALAAPQVRSLPWQATLAGGGDLAPYRACIAARGLAGRVELPGWTAAAEVRSLFARASIFVLPSLIENLPLALLEAMSYGLCPVVTPVGAIPEVVCHGVSGLIVPAGEPGALAEALRKLLGDPVLRGRLGQAARGRFKESYDIRGYVTRLTEQYELAKMRSRAT